MLDREGLEAIYMTFASVRPTDACLCSASVELPR